MIVFIDSTTFLCIEFMDNIFLLKKNVNLCEMHFLS